MYKVRLFLKKILTPVTVMIIPHASRSPRAIKIPFSLIVLSVFLWCAGTIYVISIAVKTYEYYNMKQRLSYFMNQFVELKGTIWSLQKAEEEFRRLFSLKSKRQVLEAVEVTDTGSIDIEAIKAQINETINTVTEIKRYLSEQKDLYRATPMGWPVRGVITSGFGKRIHPRYGEVDFHSGIDISVPIGTEVRATADGIVVFSGWTPDSGYTIIINHGHGFSTAYAHNKENLVKVGQTVKRGDVIALSGNTGITTGPHLHYEVWKNGTPVNPVSYLKENF